MNQIKMQVINARISPLNRWDKDSIRPGPVGTVGDVNLQVKLRNSAPDMAQRYDKTYSGKNEKWSGSNISDGQWTGFTSGGRGALTLTQPMPVRSGFKTPVGWMIENIVPVDRSKIAKMVPLGQYSWETEKARIYRAKTSGDQFLPLPNSYNKLDTVPRGSQYPKIVAASIGDGIVLPAADVKITDPIFGENGYIDVEDGTNQIGIPETGLDCRPQDLDPSFKWAPTTNDPRRKYTPPNDYPWRKVVNGKVVNMYPDIGPNESVGTAGDWWGWKIVKNVTFNPCATTDRPSSEPYHGTKRPRPNPPRRLPKPGDNRKGPIGKPQPPDKRIKV
jgi:hypothetical protein